MLASLLLLCAAGAYDPFGPTDKMPPRRDYCYDAFPTSLCHCPHDCDCPAAQGLAPCECGAQRHETACSKGCCCGCNESGYCTCGKKVSNHTDAATDDGTRQDLQFVGHRVRHQQTVLRQPTLIFRPTSVNTWYRPAPTVRLTQPAQRQGRNRVLTLPMSGRSC